MSYLKQYLSGELIDITVRKIEESKDFDFANRDFDTIAVRGVSGVLMGSVLAHRWDKDLLISRKRQDSSHSEHPVEGWGLNQRILIVDDFIESGATVNSIYFSILAHCDGPTFEGILLYGGKRFDDMSYLYTLEDETKLMSWYIRKDNAGMWGEDETN